jgi:hypothetical protein
MARILSVLVVIAGMLLGTGMAEAQPATYKVSGSWTLMYVNGQPTVRPHIQDDVVEVTCRSGNKMTDYSVNNRNLVAGSWPRKDGTGIQVQPKFTGKNEILKVTVSCKRA